MMNKKLIFFICLIAMIFSAACVSAAEDIDQTNIGDTSNLDANGDILAISSSENEILGADEPGTFTELQQMVDSGNATINLTKDFQWDDAFTDHAIRINNPITINGNGHTIDALNRNDLRIFEINNVNSGIILDNITFKNGNTASYGGAINIISALSDSKFTNLNFINNTAKYNGGAVRFYKASENNLFENITFINNTGTDGNGGALYMTETSTSDTFKKVIFANNVATSNTGKRRDGGAINFHKEVDGATFDNVLFYNNRAEKSVGGAINIDKDIKNSIFNNTYFINNSAKTGGAIGITGTISSLTFENTKFINNTALVDDGGAINIGPWGHSDLANTTFKNVLFKNNTAAKEGGAIYVTANTLSNTFENVEFINNTAGTNAEADRADGGAIKFGANSSYTTEKNTFKNVNFTNNTAKENGGALYVTGKSTSNTFENVDFINNTAKIWDGGAINFYKAVNNTTFEEVLFYKNSAPSSGGGALNFDNGMENTRFTNTLFVENSALYTSAIAISGETSSNTIENSIFYNNTADNYLICIVDSVSDNVIHDSIFLNNDDYNYYAITTVSGDIELTDNWFGNNATNYDENPEVCYNLDNWLFLNATANPAAITLNQTSTVTFKFSSFKDGSGVEEYDGPVYIFLQLSSTLGTLNRTVALTDDEIVYTPSESGNGSVTGKFLNVYYTVNIENDKIPTEINLVNNTLNVTVLEFITDVATLDPAEAGNLSYSSSNSSIVQIYNDRIIPVSEGSAIITVSFDGDEIYAAAENKTITVNVRLNDASVSVDNDTLNLFVEDTYAINATTVPDFLKDFYINYVSSNESVATVDGNGAVTAVGEGTAIITVEVGDDKIFAKNSTNVTVTVSKIPTEITVENTKIEMNPLDFAAINATLTPADAGRLRYTSSNSSVATILLGRIVAVGEGEATITVSFDGNEIYAAAENKTIDVIVTKIPTEITVENTTIEMNPLDIASAGANLVNASNLLLTYTSSNSSVATVILGEIIAVGEGTATITVSFNGTTRYAAAENKSIDVIVTKIPTEITVENTTIEMNPLDIASAGASLTPGLDLTLSYTSSNTSVARVILGEIIAVGEGEATITVSFDGNIRYEAAESKTIDVIVTKIPTEITVENTTIEMNPFDIVSAGAKLNPTLAGLINYTSSNSSVAIVVLGEIIAVGEGEATITAAFDGNVRYEAAESKTIDVIVTKIPTEITVENTTIEMAPFDVVSAGANLTPADAGFLRYTSSNSSVATVILGQIIAVGEGTATITVSFNGTTRYEAAENKTIEVTVSKIPTEITVENATVDLKVLQSAPAQASLTPDEAGSVSYTSSNSSVAAVVLGQIIAVGEGTATITVSYDGNDRYAAAENKTITVTVSLWDASVSVDNDTLDLIVEDTYAINATTSPEILKYLSLNYTSSDESVATVDENGTVTAVGEGTAIITVTVGQGRIFAVNSTNVTVTVSRIATEITANTTENLTVGDEANITYAVTPEEAEGDVRFMSDDASIAFVDPETGLIVARGRGTTTITVSFFGNEKYAPSNTTLTVVVSGIDYEPNVTLDDETLTVEVPEDATGEVTLLIGNETLVAPIKDGIATFDLSDIPAGDYNATVMYPGDNKYDGFEMLYPVSLVEDFIITAENVTKYYGGSERFEVIITDGRGNPIADAKVSITINGQKYDRTTDKYGEASIGINLNSGEYPVTVTYNETTVDAKVTVLTTVNGTDIVKVFRNGTQYYATFLDSDGNYLKEGTLVTFNIHGVFYGRNVGENGLTKLNINLEPGEYIITAINTVTGEQSANNITVLSKITENQDITKYYKNGTQYTAKIIGDDGNPVGAGETVTFNINGVFYQRQTDANGIVQLNINLNPGDYIVTAQYKECMVANNIKVLPVLTAQDLNKKYGTPDPFVATLVDGQGKPYADQKVEFNINGVFYYRTTDSNGQAKLNINLMPGQYIITSGYNGAYIANTVTVTA